MRSFIRIAVIGVMGTCGAVGVALAGCSVTSTSATDGDGGGGGGNDGSTNNGDGGGVGREGGTDGAGGGGDGSTTTSGVDSVILVTGGGPRFSIVASFRSMPAPKPAGCTITDLGVCVLAACPAVDGIPSSSLNAGAITIRGSGPDSPVTLTLSEMGDAGIMGYFAKGTSQLFAAGDTITASGAGGPDVPAFTAQTIVAPNEIVVTSPACASNVCPDFARSVDAPIAWTGGGAGKMYITYITNTDDGSKELTCSFDAQAGSGTVPTAALMTLDPGTAPGFYGVAIMYPMNSTIITVGTLKTMLGAQGGSSEGTFTTTD